MDLISIIIGSSTPDGLAPLSPLGVLIFVVVLTSLSIIWGLANFYVLLKKAAVMQEEGQSMQGVNAAKSFALFQLCQKVMIGALNFLKYCFAICLVAGIIFFLCILSAIEHLNSVQISLAYLYGVLSAIFIGVVVSIASQMSISRISISATISVYSTFMTGKNISNFISYFISGFTTLIIFLILFLYQDKGINDINIEDIRLLSKSLIAYSFGVSTVTIGAKISCSIYGKGSECSLSLMSKIQPKMPRNDKSPLVICKAIGENLNKIVTHALDYNMYLSICLTGALACGGLNIVGADQNGEIIFDYSICNIYLPLIAISFILFFSMLVSIISYFLFSPDSGDECALIFKRQIYMLIFFLTGFLALASYLSLPVQFIIGELTNLKGPYMAYLIMLIALFVMFIIMLVGEVEINHPRFIYSLINSSKSGAATNLLAGLSFGYFGNAIPIVAWTGIGFLSYYWLGSYGVGLLSIGIASLLPNYLTINTFFASIENASFIAYITQGTEEMLGTMMAIAQNRRLYQTQIHSHLNSLALTSNYCIFLYYITIHDLVGTSLIQSSVYAGLLVGSMIGYVYSSLMILAIQKVTPVLCYDLKSQIEQVPQILEGTAEADMGRSNFIFSLNCILKFKYFLPFLFGPFVIIGIGFGPKCVLGMMAGLLISGIQLSMSSGLSGHIWNSVRSEIFLGKARDQQENQIKADSIYGIAADVGNQVGLKLRDAVSSSVHCFVTFTCLLSCVMGSIYVNLH